MRDLNDLETKTLNPSARRHFHEGVLAMRAGAYRAAIVQAWIAVSIDLMAKVRSRAQSDTWVVGLNNAIKNRDAKNMSRCEGELIREAGRLQLLTSFEMKMLERLREDRNLCAHPAFVEPGETFSPTPELVRSHLAMAVDSCLSVPPILGKEIIVRLKLDLDSQSWPTADSLPAYLKEKYFTSVREATKSQLTKYLIKESIIPPDSSELEVVKPETFALRCADAIDAIHDFDSPLLRQSTESVCSAWDANGKLRDEVILSMTGVLGHFRWFWDTVGEPYVAKAEALLERGDLETLLRCRVFACGSPDNQRAMDAMQRRLVRDEVDPRVLSTISAQMRHDKRVLVPAVIQSLQGARTFRAGEARLRLLLGVADSLSAKDIEIAAGFIRGNNQIYEASEVPAILENLYQETKDVVGAQEAWESLANGLNSDYLGRNPSDPDGYYSYSKLLAAVCGDA